MTDHVSGDKFEARVFENGLVRVDWVDGTTVTVTDTQQVPDAFATLHDNVAGPVLAELRPVAAVEREARKMFASTTVTSRQALVVSPPLSRTIGNFFLTINRPTMPVKIFDDEATAVAWLHDDG